MKRVLFFTAGMGMTGLGFLGAFLPVMPSTVFLITAVYFFSKSNQRFENWLLEHPRFGPTLVAWRRYGAISRAGKTAAALGMSVGMFFMLISPAPLWVKLLSAAFIGGSAIYVLSRPTLRMEAYSNSQNLQAL